MRSLIGMGVVVALAAALPAQAGLFGRKARPAQPPVAYDQAAIDSLLYPLPSYDNAAIGALISDAEADPARRPKPRWSAAARLTPTRQPLRLSMDTAPWPLAGEDVRYSPIDFAQDGPGLVGVSVGAYDFDVTPHAGFDFGRRGGRAGAGAFARLGSLGRVRDGRELGQAERWYLFGAASGQAVGWNFAGASEEPWRAMGLTRDRVSGVIAEAQAGVAWRKGAMQASLGYTRRRIRLKGDLAELSGKLDLDLFPRSDDALTFTYSYAPAPPPSSR